MTENRTQEKIREVLAKVLSNLPKPGYNEAWGLINELVDSTKEERSAMIQDKIKELRQRMNEYEDANKVEMSARIYFQIKILEWVESG